MKKSLIALAALSAFATAAQAQSSVSVYGSIDAGFGDIDTKTSNVGELSKSATASSFGSAGVGKAAAGALTSSRLGFKGTEDLGGGLAANFNLEYALDNGTGTTTTSNIRTSTVGLSSTKFGSLNIGRQLTGMHGVLTATSPLASNNLAGDIIYSDSAVKTSDVGLRMHAYTDGVSAVRASNSVAYVTPVFSGFTARVDYASDKSNADTSKLNNDVKQDHLGLSATYNQGPLLVTAGTHTVKTKAAAAAAKTGFIVKADGSTDTLAYGASAPSGSTTLVSPTKAITAANDDAEYTTDAVAARYTIGDVKLNAIYAKKTQSYEGVKALDQDALQFGVSYDLGKFTFAGSYGEGAIKSTSPTADSFGQKWDTKAYQFAAIYNLSKRTNVYAAYGTEETKVSAAPKDVTQIGDKTERTQYAVGLRHSF